MQINVNQITHKIHGQPSVGLVCAVNAENTELPKKKRKKKKNFKGKVLNLNFVLFFKSHYAIFCLNKRAFVLNFYNSLLPFCRLKF